MLSLLLFSLLASCTSVKVMWATSICTENLHFYVCFSLALLPQIFNYRSNIIGHTTRTLRRQNFFVRLLLDHRRSLLMVCFCFNRATRLCSRPTDSTRRQQLRPTDGKKNRQQTVVLCNGEEKTAEREKRKTSLVLLQAGCGLHDDRQPNRAFDGGFLSGYQIDLAQLSRSFFQRSWKIDRLPAITGEHNNIAAIIPTPSVVRHVLVYANSSRTLFPTAKRLSIPTVRLSRKQRKLFVGLAIILRETLARTRSDQGQV